jgi:hypothetical protein
MLRRVAVILVIVFCVAGLAATSAFASGGDPFTLEENDAAMMNQYRQITTLPTLPPSAINPSTGSPYTTVEEFNGVTKARLAGGFGLPALNTMTTIAMGGAAIYSAYQLGNYFRFKISGDTAATVTGASPSWGAYCGAGVTGDNGSTAGCSTSSSSWGAANFGGWGVTGSTGGVGVGFQVCSQGCWVLSMGSAGGYCTPSTLSSCTGTFSASSAVAAARASIIANSDPSLINVDFNDTAGSTDCKAVAACTIIWRTWDQMRRAVKLETCTSSCYTGANVKKDVGTPVATNGGTANNPQNANQECGGFDGVQVLSAEREACRAVFNYFINPSCDTDGSNCVGSSAAGNTTTIIGGGGSSSAFVPFVIPKPGLSESYEDYLQRLRDKGYVGTVTVDEVDSSPWVTSAAGRGAPDGTVLGVKVGSGVEVYQYDPSTGDLNSPEWPDNPDPITDPSVVVTLTKTPDGTFDPSAPPAPGGVDTGSGTGLTFPSIHSPCDKFPFGVFCWIGGAIDALVSADPIPPSITLPSISIPMGGVVGMPDSWDSPEITWSVSEIPDDDWAAFYIVAACVAFFVWLLGLWFVGSRMTVGGSQTLEDSSE